MKKHTEHKKALYLPLNAVDGPHGSAEHLAQLNNKHNHTRMQLVHACKERVWLSQMELVV